MKKTFYAGLLIILLLGIILVPGTAAAADGITVTDNRVTVDFPMSIVFSIDAQSGDALTDIRLHYTVERQQHATVVTEAIAAFTPGAAVTATWTWDMRYTGGMPPGTEITYWWTLEDAAGDEAETLPRAVVIEDTRYDWRSLSEGLVTLYWYAGDDEFAAELMEATQLALTRLSENTGAELLTPVSLYIYENSTALRGALIFAQEWTGGVAFSQYGTVAIGISPSGSDMTWGKRVISHELTHLVVNQVIFNPYGDIPVWLSEGLAVMGEGETSASFAAVFQAGVNSGSLISIRSLASPFSTDTNTSYLSYAESEQVVRYLIGTYGRDKMLELLETFAAGSTYDGALEKVYGFDMDGLNAEWLASLGVAATS